jgi:hypothetical protein
VEALEAQASNYPETPDSSTPPPVATDEELDDTWHKTTGGTFLARRRAIYNLGVTHGQAGSREVAEPAPATVAKAPPPRRTRPVKGAQQQHARRSRDNGRVGRLGSLPLGL